MNLVVERHAGSPLYLVGVALSVYAVYHLLVDTGRWLIAWGEAALLVVLASVVVFGGYRISRMELAGPAVLLAVAGVLGAYLFGVLFAGILIGLQFLAGVAIVDVQYLLVTSGTATAALGVAVVLYYQQLRVERTALARRNEEVNSINKRLRLLQRVLRHNLRNEVTVIRGHANLVLERADDDEVRASADAIERRAARVEQFSDNADLLRQVWDTDIVVEQDAVRLARRALADVRERFPAATVRTDLVATAPVTAHPRFESAVVEAVENAVVHTDGEVAVAVRRDGDDRVEITVADTGDGIPDIEVAALDQPEERPLLHSTGLGLWLLYWLTEKSDGDLRFEDNEPRGTVVRMWLPAACA